MKYKLIILFLFFFCHSFSQEQTKKWNTITKRYEYFDSQRRLIGYEKYNNILKQWEYYDSKHKNKYENYNKSIDDFYSDLSNNQDQTIAYLNNLQQRQSNEKLRNYIIQLQNEARIFANNAIEANSNENYLAAAQFSINAYNKMSSIYQYVSNKDDVQKFRIQYISFTIINFSLAGNYIDAKKVLDKSLELFPNEKNIIDIKNNLEKNDKYRLANNIFRIKDEDGDKHTLEELIKDRLGN